MWGRGGRGRGGEGKGTSGQEVRGCGSMYSKKKKASKSKDGGCVRGLSEAGCPLAGAGGWVGGAGCVARGGFVAVRRSGSLSRGGSVCLGVVLSRGGAVSLSLSVGLCQLVGARTAGTASRQRDTSPGTPALLRHI